MNYLITNSINAEALKRQMERPMISRNRLTLPIDKKEAADLLQIALKSEVESRGRDFIMSPCLESRIARAAGWLTNPDGSMGLMLGGQCGNGKTTLAKAIQKFVLCFNVRDNSNRIIEIRFRTAKELVSLCLNDPEQWVSVMASPMLIIDDMGEEATEVEKYRNIQTPITDLIELRYARQLTTIVTTNIKPADIKDKYGNRVADRLNEMMECIGFGNASYRTFFTNKNNPITKI